jgi:hypothetical protein
MICSICNEKGHRSNNKKYHPTYELIKNNKIKDKIVIPEKLRSDIVDNIPKVLEICPIPESIDINYIKDNVKEYMKCRKTFYIETGRNPYIEDEFSEYWIEKASKGKQIGKGNCGMDVKTNKNEGIDVMCVIMNKGTSNEKSLMQNFSSAGKNLDTLFTEKKDVEALSLFTEEYISKIKKTKLNNNLNNLYILSFISTKKNIYIVCFKLYIDRINNVKTKGFTEKIKNIKTDHFIDSKLGDIRLYKSKKRLELRLKNNIIYDKHTVNLYDIE